MLHELVGSHAERASAGEPATALSDSKYVGRESRAEGQAVRLASERVGWKQ